MSGFENASGHAPPPQPEPPSAPPSPEPPGDRLWLVLLSLGGTIVVLLIVLIGLWVTRDAGSDPAAATSDPAPSAVSESAPSNSGPDATIPSTTAAAAVTSTTVAPTSTAATTTTMVVLPAFVTEDCVSYDPAAVEIEDLGADGWQLTGGLSGLVLFDTQQDAQMGLVVAANHTGLCFLGRGNAQPDPSRYIHEFWYGDSGAGVPVPGPEDCLAHDQVALSIESPGGDVWQLMEGDRPMVSFAGEADALAGLELARAFGERCFIGRDNERSERRLYIVEYWK